MAEYELSFQEANDSSAIQNKIEGMKNKPVCCGGK